MVQLSIYFPRAPQRCPWFFYGCFIDFLCFIGFVLSFFDRILLRLLFVYHCACCAPQGGGRQCRLALIKLLRCISVEHLEVQLRAPYQKNHHIKKWQGRFSRMRCAYTPLFGFNSHLSQSEFFRKSSAIKRKSDAFIRGTVIDRVYNVFKRQEGVNDKTKYIGKNTTKS